MCIAKSSPTCMQVWYTGTGISSLTKFIIELHVWNDTCFTGEKPVVKGTGEEVVVQWEKMSKSKYNGVDPQVSSQNTALCQYT